MPRPNKLLCLAANSILLVVLCFFTSVRLAQADTYDLSYSLGGSTSAGGNNTGPELIFGPTPGQNPSGPILSGAYGPITSSFDNGTLSASATTQALVSVSPGRIGISGSAFAIQNGGARARATFVGQGVFNDVLTITHPTLAAGSPVDLMFTLSVEYEGNGIINALFAASESSDRFLNLLFANDVPQNNSPVVSGVFSTTVGKQLNLRGILFAQGLAFGDANGSLVFIDALNSANFYIRPVTPGASFTSASGATYSAAAPVPEPATLLLLGTGLAGVGAAVRKRRRAGKGEEV